MIKKDERNQRPGGYRRQPFIAPSPYQKSSKKPLPAIKENKDELTEKPPENNSAAAVNSSVPQPD